MAKQHYVAVLERGLNDSFGVFFPDLPGCVSAGTTAEEAMIEARDALTLHVEGMVEDGLPLPSPSPVTAFGEDDFTGADIVSLFIVPVNVPEAPKETPMRINVSLLPSLIERIDAAATQHHMTRSAVLAVASRQWLGVNMPSHHYKPGLASACKVLLEGATDVDMWSHFIAVAGAQENLSLKIKNDMVAILKKDSADGSLHLVELLTRENDDGPQVRSTVSAAAVGRATARRPTKHG